MEIASLLAGEAWSDYPRTTDPVLALLARAVNDAVSARARAGLAPMIPAVLDTDRGDVRVPIRLVELIAYYGLAHGTGAHARHLDRAVETTDELTTPSARHGLRGGLHRRRTRARVMSMSRPVIGQAVADLAFLEGGQADAALTDLLRKAIVATREITHSDGPALVDDPCGLARVASRMDSALLAGKS